MNTQIYIQNLADTTSGNSSLPPPPPIYGHSTDKKVDPQQERYLFGTFVSALYIKQSFYLYNIVIFRTMLILSIFYYNHYFICHEVINSHYHTRVNFMNMLQRAQRMSHQAPTHPPIIPKDNKAGHYLYHCSNIFIVIIIFFVNMWRASY